MDPTKTPHHPIIMAQPGEKKPVAVRCGEVMGGKTAECAAICCCCPCAVIDLVVLLVVKLPAGLCKKAMRKRSSRLRRKRALKEAKVGENKSKKGDVGTNGGGAQLSGKEVESETVVKEVKEEEEEMWARFYSAGFWRSPSQRDNDKAN